MEFQGKVVPNAAVSSSLQNFQLSATFLQYQRNQRDALIDWRGERRSGRVSSVPNCAVETCLTWSAMALQADLYDV
jgi:hypothetical protein